MEFGETLEQALKREMLEELGVEIEVLDLLGVANHILPEEKQHWISPTFFCRIVTGLPKVMEPGKCDALAWKTVSEAAALPLSKVTQHDITQLQRRGYA